MSQTTTFTISDNDGNTVVITVPAKRVVCDDCGGEGTVLCAGMRGHAYSTEEFDREFDDEQKEEYFRRGGMYDVQCPTCKGRNVVDVPDESRFNAEQREAWEQHQSDRDEQAAYDRQCAAERRMGA